MSIKRIAFVSATAALFASGVVHAHPRLLATLPRANTAVVAPTRIALTFSERLLPMSGGTVTMTGPAARQAPVAGFTRAVAADGRTLQLTSARPLARGTYQVSWHAVAADTHRVAGVFAFAVK